MTERTINPSTPMAIGMVVSVLGAAGSFAWFASAVNSKLGQNVQLTAAMQQSIQDIQRQAATRAVETERVHADLARLVDLQERRLELWIVEARAKYPDLPQYRAAKD